MKKITVLLFLFATLQMQASQQQLTNLCRIAKFWGFLKYYHPDVASGKIDWDSVLLRRIDELKDLDRKRFDRGLEDWFNELPIAKLSPSLTQPRGDSVFRVFDSAAIKSFGLTAKLTQALQRLYDYHLPQKSVYITDTYKTYKLDYLLNIEKKYEEPAFPDRNLRLLSLFRYWNIINYQYPHKRLIPKNWNKTLEAYIPYFMELKNREEYTAAIQQLITSLEDSHSFYREKDFDAEQQFHMSFGLVAIKGKFYVNELYSASLAAKEGIALGDQLLRINGIKISDFINEKLYYVTGSNKYSKARDYCRQLFRADKSRSFEVELLKGKEKVSRTINKYTYDQLMNLIPQRSMQSLIQHPWKELSSGVWLVEFCKINTEQQLDTLFKRIKGAQGIVWDMRGYPNYALLDKVYETLMPDELKIGVNANAMLDFPGTFRLSPDNYKHSSSPENQYLGRMVVLVNETTQSLSESVSATLSLRPNTIVMGSQTAGTTGNINYIDLPGGIRVSFTAVGFYGEDRSFRQKKGVKVGIAFRPGRRGLSEKKDTLLKKAIEYIVDKRNKW